MKRREVRAKLKDHRVRKLLADELKRGREGTETYSVRHEETGETIFFNISAMREWAESNLDVVPTAPNFDVAARLVADGTVDADYIAQHTLRAKPKPIIICSEVFEGDQVVDGSHRFVAFCAGCARWGLKDRYFPAYVLKRDEWQQFVIPGPVVRALGFDKSYERWLETRDSITE